MSLNLSGFLLVCVGLSLIFVTLSLVLLRGANPARDSYSGAARFFLICLRLAIGWHCFVEGMEKISTPNWSSEPYLRESMGPLAGFYHDIAGDRLIDQLTVGDDGAIPAELDREWREYLDAFAAYYDLDSTQRQRAEEILKERESAVLAAFKKPEPVAKIAAYPPELTVDMTMAGRLKDHERLLERVRTAEAKFPTDDKGVHAEWKAAKADLAKWRAELKRAIDVQTDKLKRTEEAAREKSRKKIEELTAKLKKLTENLFPFQVAEALEAQNPTKDGEKAGRPKKDKKNEALAAKWKNEVDGLKKESDAEKAKVWETLRDVLTSEQKQRAPMPEPAPLPVGSWRLLEYADFGVKWGLTVLGACLLLGIFSRFSSFLTALLILSFYLAMPPLPGWPEGPRLEGHYLIVNKTLIEVIALLALTFIPTGRWAGLDGLLQFVLPGCCGGVKQSAATLPPN